MEQVGKNKCARTVLLEDREHGGYYVIGTLIVADAANAFTIAQDLLPIITDWGLHLILWFSYTVAVAKKIKTYESHTRLLGPL
jgi:hypothetical protein